MDENISWKIVYVACIFSLIILGIAYYLISPKESPFFTEEKTEKIAEFKETRVSGRKEGKKVWEFYAQEGWTTKDREITYLSKIRQGEIYKGGKVVVHKLTAPYGKAYRHSENIEVFGLPEGQKEGPSQLKAYLALGRFSQTRKEEQDEWTKLVANSLKYFPAEKRSFMEGNVELHKKDSIIYAEKIIVDHERKIADITGKIKIKRKDGVFHADSTQYTSDDERLEASGNVDLNIVDGALKTRIKSDRASFFTNMAQDMSIAGNLEVAQGKKIAVAEEGIYSQKRKELAMKGKVRAIFEKARAILKDETVKKLGNPEARKILKEKTVLTSEALVFSTHTGDATASGSVFVSQKGREAKADEAVYDEKNETLTLSGNVSLKKEEDWVSSRKVIVSIRDETFEAIGAVEAKFKF